MTKISVKLPTMDNDAAENFVGGGHLAMTLLNYLELHPEVLYNMYPNKHKFEDAEEMFGLTKDEIKDQFITANRRALMVVSYLFKYVANQAIEKYGIDAEKFEFDVENKLMMRDIDEAKTEEDDELDESEVFDELHRILGGLN